jgi:malonyl-CoA/methylmalonyl-CoA synthetase
MRDNAGLNLDAFRQWCKERLAPYKVPQNALAVPQLPKNAMGKVSKLALKDHLLAAGVKPSMRRRR